MTRKDVYIHETAEVSPKAEIGGGTKIWHQAQIRENAQVGGDCIIGKSAYIDESVKIGSNCKIQNRVSIYKGVTIEDDVFIGPHVAFTNDFRPRAFTKNFKIIKTLVKKGASISANSTIVCGVEIGEYAMIGAGSVVTKNIPPNALAYGNPAKIRGFVCKCGEKITGARVEGDQVTLKCACGQEYKIPKKIYETVE
ncbi:MAG TPA: N-acetyltransferase [Candidatus Altiarchaeales archaeon]|nr:N-acetyltransferase [Candidatus Altiarchaeales archaeon]